jgi:predicted RNA binding protein YcfA (HicA-like mRNA interferase family)
LPPKPTDLVRVLKRLGFEESSSKGSHRTFSHPDGRSVVVAFHRRELKKGTYHAILKAVGLTEEQYRKL